MHNMKKPLFFIMLAIGLAFPITAYILQEEKHQAVKLTRGKETITSVMEKISEPASKRFAPYFKQAGFQLEDIQKLTYIGLKDEKQFEIWAYVHDEWKLLRKMPILGASGGIGHKLRQGDWQVPEGIYELDYFNPNSSAHVSIHITYPSKDDRAWAAKEGRSNLGGDIMIHGSRTSIGCLAMGDVGMEDIFWLSRKIGLKNIRVILAPYDMRKMKHTLPDTLLGKRYNQIHQALIEFN